MTERCICEDYEIRGKPYEVWTDGTRSGDYPNWWLTADHHKPGWVLTEDDFEPRLTDKEVKAISEYVYDRLVG